MAKTIRAAPPNLTGGTTVSTTLRDLHPWAQRAVRAVAKGKQPSARTPAWILEGLEQCRILRIGRAPDGFTGFVPDERFADFAADLPCAAWS